MGTGASGAYFENMNNNQFGQALTSALHKVAAEHANIKKCGVCKKFFDQRDAKYLCGYGKCPTCDGSCGHRNYPNPNYRGK